MTAGLSQVSNGTVTQGASLSADTLTKACQTKNLDLVLEAIKRGAKPDEKTLTYACLSGKIKIVKAVLEVGAKPDIETLPTACSTKKRMIVAKAIKGGAEANEKALEEAKKTEDERIIKRVTRAYKKQHPSSKHSSSKRPSASQPPALDMLSKACQTNDLEVVQLAIGKGARPDAETLTWACASGNEEVIDAVIAVEAKPDNETLTAACATGQLSIVKKVLDLGAKPNDKTLEIAEKTENSAIISLIKKMKPPSPAASHTESPPTPKVPSDKLTIACRTKDLSLVKEAIASGAEPDDRTLSTACLTGNLDIVNTVIVAGAKPSADTLTCACKCGSQEMIERLLTEGAKPNAETLDAILDHFYALQQGVDLLHEYFNAGRVFGKLLKAGAEPSQNTLYKASLIRGSGEGLLYRVLQSGKAKALDSKSPFSDVLTNFFPEDNASARSTGSCGYRTPENFEKLIQLGGQPNECTFMVALEFALCVNEVQFVKIALEAGIKPVSPYENHDPINTALRDRGPNRDKDRTEFIRTLLQGGVKPLPKYIEFAKEHVTDLIGTLKSLGIKPTSQDMKLAKKTKFYSP
jgi:hypothetical protein